MKHGWWVLALCLAGCRGELPPPREHDVVDVLVDTVVAKMGQVAVVGRPSDCRRTEVPVPPGAWAAFLEANRHDAGTLDLARHSTRLTLDASGDEAETVRARRGMPVVALSRVGVAGNDALLCVEIYGAGDRGYYLLFRRDGRGQWSLRSEHAAWEESAESWELPPEELPDGTVYEN